MKVSVKLTRIADTEVVLGEIVPVITPMKV